MSNDGGFAGARKIQPAPLPQFLPSSPVSSLSANTHIYRSPIIPLPEEDPLAYLFPRKVQVDPEKHPLRHAGKNFFPKKLDSASAAELASRLVAYFSRPTEGWYEEVILRRDGSEERISKPYKSPLPLVAEFANIHGMTEKELKEVAKEFPDTLGRAMDFASDVVKTSLIRGGLDGTYNHQAVAFVATNETSMRLKSEHTERRMTLNLNELAKRLEAASTPDDYAE